jgi:hypothetical protein
MGAKGGREVSAKRLFAASHEWAGFILIDV